MATLIQSLYSSVPPSLKRARSFEEHSNVSTLSDMPARDTLPSILSNPTRSLSIQLPGLAALASMASQAANSQQQQQEKSSENLQTPPPPNTSMSYATAAPGQPTGAGAAPPICQNCETSTTPLWRRDESGSVLCNACGLFFKLHGRARPISLKTDVIKSRNRVKPNAQGGQKKKPPLAQGLAAAHPDIAHGNLNSTAAAATRRVSRQTDGAANNDSPISRSGTPSFPQPSNIAPQHMFDTATLDPSGNPTTLSTPYITHAPAQHRNASPSAAPLAFDGPTSYADLVTANTLLKTRVSELEVINDLFRGRVTELESGEAEARRQLDDALRREADLKGRLEGLGVVVESEDARQENGDVDAEGAAVGEAVNGDEGADKDAPQGTPGRKAKRVKLAADEADAAKATRSLRRTAAQ